MPVIGTREPARAARSTMIFDFSASSAVSAFSALNLVCNRSVDCLCAVLPKCRQQRPHLRDERVRAAPAHPVIPSATVAVGTGLAASPRAQIRACGFPAPGSCLGRRRCAVRGFGDPCSCATGPGRCRWHVSPVLCPERVSRLSLPSTRRLPSIRSTAGHPALSADFIGTTHLYDFSCRASSASALRLPDADRPATSAWRTSNRYPSAHRRRA